MKWIFFLKFAETNTEEDLEQVKFFNHDIKLSRSEILKLLEKANLTSHGYEREVSTKTVRRPESNKSEFKVSNAAIFPSALSSVALDGSVVLKHEFKQG